MAVPEVTRIPVSLLLIQDDEPPMHLGAVVDLATGTRTDGRPLDVEAVEGTPHYRIRNGRHRFLAAVMAAAPDVPCIVRQRAP